jgi:hypothetical protein
MRTFYLIHNDHYNTLIWYKKYTVNDLGSIGYFHEAAIRKYGDIYVNNKDGWMTFCRNSHIIKEIQAKDFPLKDSLEA